VSGVRIVCRLLGSGVHTEHGVPFDPPRTVFRSIGEWMNSEKRKKYIPRVLKLQYHFSLHFSLNWLLGVMFFSGDIQISDYSERLPPHPQSGSLPPQRVRKGLDLLCPVFSPSHLHHPATHSASPSAPQLTQSTPRYSFLVPWAAYGRVQGEDLQERASGFRNFGIHAHPPAWLESRTGSHIGVRSSTFDGWHRCRQVTCAGG
jgi:hypothetical protein